MDIEVGSEDACLRVEEVWVEILAPVETAHALIMQALEGIVLPAGLSVAKSERGTLLLNAKAWSTFHTPLKSLSSLQMQHPSLAVSSRGLKFSLHT